MANTLSSKKAIRSSSRKYEHNTFWKRRIKTARKSLNVGLKPASKDKDAGKEMLSNLFSVLDKAVKNKVIHKNRASRLKAKYTARVSK